jgi:hypothetical protein
MGVTSLVSSWAPLSSSPKPVDQVYIKYWDGYGGHTGLFPTSGAPVATNKDIRHPVPILESSHTINKVLQENI